MSFPIIEITRKLHGIISNYRFIPNIIIWLSLQGKEPGTRHSTETETKNEGHNFVNRIAFKNA